MQHKPAKSHPINEQNVKSEINVTPLVDVVLVLLIIFMVVTPMLQKGVDVMLPETVSPEKMPENSKQLIVAIKQDGTSYVDKDRIAEEQLLAMFKDLYERNPDREIIIKADRRIEYKEVRKMMQVINEAGFDRVGLITERKTTG